MQLVDQPFADSFHRDTEEDHFLEEIGCVSLITTDAAQIFCDDNIKPTIKGTDEQGIDAGAIFDVCSGQGLVPIDLNDIISLETAEFLTATDLIF